MKFIITGASRGIGKFLFQHYYQKGFDVFGTYQNTEPKDLPLERMYKANVADTFSMKEFANTASLSGNRIIAINCAGINYNAFGHKADPDKWGQVIDVNLKGSFNFANSVLPFMRESEFGRIIFLSSVVAKMGIPGTSAYAASKAGLWGLTKALAVENATKGITVNSINLGYFDIGMIGEVPEEMKKVIISKIPAGKFGNPDNIISLIDYFITSDYSNGSIVDINGGLI